MRPDDEKAYWRVPVVVRVPESNIQWYASLLGDEPSPGEVAEYIEERLSDQLPQFDVEVDKDAPEREVKTGAPG